MIILASQAAIETHLRYEYFDINNSNKWTFCELIDNSDIDDDLKKDLHTLRKYRNKWVHVDNPRSDDSLLEQSDYKEKEIENMAKYSIRVMLQTLYSYPFI